MAAMNAKQLARMIEQDHQCEMLTTEGWVFVRAPLIKALGLEPESTRAGDRYSGLTFEDLIDKCAAIGVTNLPERDLFMQHDFARKAIAWASGAA